MMWRRPLVSGILAWIPLAFCLCSVPMVQAHDVAATVPELNVIYLDEAPLKITSEEFKKFPRTKVEAKDKDGKPVTYAGVALHHLLRETQTPLGELLRAGALRCYLSVEAKDGYRVIFALPEIDPDFTDRIVLLADELNSKPLDDRHGPYQIIVPDEKRHARWVRSVQTIRILESKASADTIALPAR